MCGFNEILSTCLHVFIGVLFDMSEVKMAGIAIIGLDFGEIGEDVPMVVRGNGFMKVMINHL